MCAERWRSRKSGPNMRATEVFINLADNKVLDEQGFVPFARIVSGMEVPDKLYSGYGELGPEGKGPDSGRVEGGSQRVSGPEVSQARLHQARQVRPPRGSSAMKEGRSTDNKCYSATPTSVESRHGTCELRALPDLVTGLLRRRRDDSVHP